MASGLEQLAADHGLDHLVCEGGPTLNAALLRTGLVDELCVTVAPLLSGAGGSGIVKPPTAGAHLELLSICEQDGEIYTRYAIRAPR